MKCLYFTSAIALLASTALADITPEALMVSWANTFAQTRFDLTIGAQAYEADVLVLRDVQLAARADLSTPSLNVDWMRLSPLPDGIIEITFSNFHALEPDSTVPNAHLPSFFPFTSFSGLILQASGEPERIVYHISSESLEGSQSTSTPPVLTQKNLVLTGVSGRFTQQENSSGGFQVFGQINIDSVVQSWNKRAKYSGSAEGSDTFQEGRLRIENLLTGFNLVAPESGNAYALTVSAIAVGENPILHLDGGEAEPNFTLDMTASVSSTSYSTQKGHLRFDLDFADISAESTSPLFANRTQSLSLKEAQFSALLPMYADTVEPEFSMQLHLKDAVLSPTTWDFFDPNGELAHLPASFDLAFSGEAIVLADVFGAGNSTGYPIRVRSFSLDNLELYVENATITGGGKVIVDIDRASALEGSGQPDITGAFDLTFIGVLSLLDHVGRLPSIDPMMIIGAKGALGMFATAGDGPDNFTSRVEFTEGGHISINGQQVKYPAEKSVRR